MRATEVAAPLTGGATSNGAAATEALADEADRHGYGEGSRRGRQRRRRRSTGGQSTAAVRTSRVVLKRVDPLSVLKVSALFYLSAWIVLLTAGVLLWLAASSAGVVENIEGFVESVGWDQFRFQPDEIVRGFALGGLVLVVAGALANVLMAVLFNLISDVLGGLKLVLAEDVERSRKV